MGSGDFYCDAESKCAIMIDTAFAYEYIFVRTTKSVEFES